MKVEEKHLTGQIADFPLHVVQLMVDEQVRQGNPADPSVFAGSPDAGEDGGGFDWDKSSAGWSFWSHVISLKQFPLAPLPKKSKRKIIQLSESMSSDRLSTGQWNLTALCDDGTVWTRSDGSSDWVRLPDIPQDGE